MALISTPFVYIWWNSFTVDSLGNIATAGDDEEPVQILTYSSHPSKIQWHMRNFAWKRHQKMFIGTSCPLFSLPPPQKRKNSAQIPKHVKAVAMNVVKDTSHCQILPALSKMFNKSFGRNTVFKLD